MSKLKSVSTAFWSDTWVEELTISQKLLFIYLLTNDRNNMLGIYEISVSKMAFETGISKADIVKALKGFESVGKVKYTHNHIILSNFLKHQNFNPNMKKSAVDKYNELPNELKINGLEYIEERDSKGFERLSNALLMLPKSEVESEEEYESESELEVESEKKTPQPKFQIEICPFFFDEDFQESWKDWVKVKKDKKASNSDRAIKRALRKIMKYSDGDKNKAIEIVSKSADSGWTDIYEPKQNNFNNQPKKTYRQQVTENNMKLLNEVKNGDISNFPF